MRRNLKLSLLAVFFAGFLQSCLSTGRDFPTRLDWIHREKTKKSDVALVLGTPYAVGNSDGTPTWTYAFYKYSPFTKTQYKELRFYWTEQDIVKTYTFNSSFPEDLSVQNSKKNQNH